METYVGNKNTFHTCLKTDQSISGDPGTLVYPILDTRKFTLLSIKNVFMVDVRFELTTNVTLLPILIQANSK